MEKLSTSVKSDVAIWSPHSPFWDSSTDCPEHSFGCNNALVILNQEIEFSMLAQLYKHCSLVVCADGGANRLLEATRGHSEYSAKRYVSFANSFGVIYGLLTGLFSLVISPTLSLGT